MFGEVFILTKDDRLWYGLFVRYFMDKIPDDRDKLGRIGGFYNKAVCTKAFCKLPVFLFGVCRGIEDKRNFAQF